MTPERNSPCPCGSGKKYKKCCGGTVEPKGPDNININRQIAYVGQVGRQREMFCETYAPRKRQGIAAIEERLQQHLATNNLTASCARGCGQCCRLFVTASLQECEIIVHYLYRHNDILDHFLKSYDGWRDRIARIRSCFQQINDLHQKITSREATAAERAQFNDECGRYAQAGNPCPFLKDNACSIYEVRPYVCAALIAVSPSDWCAVNHPRNSEAAYIQGSIKNDGRPQYFTLPAAREVVSSMPSLIYSLLHDGYAFLSTVPGLNNLRDEVERDPEVKSILISVGRLPGMSGYV